MREHLSNPAGGQVAVGAKARHQLQRLPEPLRARAEEILGLLAEKPKKPTPDTGRMRTGVANHYAYHATLDYHNRMYWTLEDDGTPYVWQIGGHLPPGAKNWS